jgi:ribosomal protein L22
MIYRKTKQNNTIMKIFESFEDFVNNGYNKIDEGKIVLKRQYGANSAVTTIKETKVRNKVLAALKDGQLSHEDFKTIVNEFSADSKKWLTRNARYFSVSEDGVTLSSYGSKVLSHINESEEVNEAKEFSFTFDYNTDEDDVEYIQNVLKKAGVNATAEAGLDSEEMVVKAANAIELRKAKKAIEADGFEINESLVNEALKSSILSSLIDMKYAPKDFLQYIYGYTKIALDQIEDTDILSMDPNTAYKRKAGKELVFYVVTNAKENPYADSSAWGDEKNLKPNTILGVASGQNEFMGANWSGNYRSTNRSKTMSKSDSGVGINKNYRGYGASGLYNVKRIAELADIAYVIDLDALQARLSTNTMTTNRAEARRGAVALLDPKKIKDENINRYKAIIAKRLTEGDKTIDKMIEKAIEDGTDLIKTAVKAKKIGQYGDIIAGTDPRGREVKLSDVSSWLTRIMDDYARFTSAEENSKKDEYSGGYYEREVKSYALSIKERVAKFEKLDIAW